APLALEAADDLEIPGERRVDHLQRDLAPHADLRSAVDRAHAAGAQHRLDAIAVLEQRPDQGRGIRLAVARRVDGPEAVVAAGERGRLTAALRTYAKAGFHTEIRRLSVGHEDSPEGWRALGRAGLRNVAEDAALAEILDTYGRPAR